MDSARGGVSRSGEGLPWLSVQVEGTARLDRTGAATESDTSVFHGVVSQIALEGLLQDQGWPADLAELVSDAVGCHHGERATERAKAKATHEIQVGRGDRLESVRQDWEKVRAGLMTALVEVFRPTVAPNKPTLSGPEAVPTVVESS